jgi:predicted transcriptional regulator
MGRPRSEVDTEKMLDLLEQGWGHDTLASELGVSKPTIAKKIGELQASQGLLLKYRALQSIQLTELQAKVLEAITPEKIDEAPLRDLVHAYKILKDRELIIDGKPTEIKGLVAYLVEMERQQLAGEKAIELDVTPQGGNGGEPSNPEKLSDFNMEDLNLQEGELI